MKNQYINKIILLLVIITTLILITLISISYTDRTRSRYLKTEHDRIIANYTSLYFTNTGNNSIIALEANKGVITIDLMNYIDAFVTERDIEYNVEVLSSFYDSNGLVITQDLETYLSNPNNELYAMDVWQVPQMIKRDTYKYHYYIASNVGGIESTNGYLFKESEGATKHTVTIEVERTADQPFDKVEEVSIIIQLFKPYKQIYIVNTYVSDQLIVFSSALDKLFNIDILKIKTQTVNSFKYFLDDLGQYVERTINDKYFTTYAFRVEYRWENLIVNENDIMLLHDNQEHILSNNSSSSPSYIDISSSHVISMNQDHDYGTLSIYVPQSSDFSFECLMTSEDYYMEAKIYIYDQDLNDFVLYDLSTWGGYSDDDREGVRIIVDQR